MTSASTQQRVPDLSGITCGAVLSGGLSSRMGQDKASMLYAGTSLLVRSLEQLEQLGLAKVVVSGNQTVCGRDVIADVIPQQGPLGAIYSLLKNANVNQFQWLLCSAVDMPKLSLMQLQQLLGYASEQNRSCYFVGHPLPCLIQINQHNYEVAKYKLNNGGSKSLLSYFNEIGSIGIEHEWGEEVFFNTNTPSDWHHLLNSL